MGDGFSDDTVPIQYFLERARRENKDAFFPPGEYVISANILVHGNTNIYGSSKGITVLKAQVSKSLRILIGNTTPNPKLSNLSISNLFFNGVRMDFTSRVYKTNILLSNCVFFIGHHPMFPVSPLTKFLDWHRVKYGVIRNVILLRSNATYGIGCGFFKTYGMSIHDNVFGLDLNNIEWLAYQYQGYNSWNQLREKLYFLKKYYNMANDQGQYRSCIYGNHDDKILIKRNIFNGNPYVRNLRDHVIYLKGFDGLTIVGNYARGWPSDPSGGFKMRNGENLVVARNYLVDTSVLLYTHNETCSYDYLHPGLSNVLVYGNHLVEKTNAGLWGSGISYLEPHFVGRDTNIVFTSNVFEIVGFNDTSRPVGIHITNGNKREHHVFRDNVYFGTSIPVKLAAFGGEVRFEEGFPNPHLTLPYNKIPVPGLVIPDYKLDEQS